MSENNNTVETYYDKFYKKGGFGYDKKLGYYKNWRNDEKLWNSILPNIESSINEKYRYGKSLDETAILEQQDE